MGDINTIYGEIECPTCSNVARRIEYNRYADATLGTCPKCKSEVEL